MPDFIAVQLASEHRENPTHRKPLGVKGSGSVGAFEVIKQGKIHKAISDIMQGFLA